MGSLGCFLLLILLSMSHVFVLGDVDMIKKTCKSTNYYGTCMSALKSNSSSAKADTRGLAIIMIGIGMVNANRTSSYLSSQLLTSTNDVLVKKVVKDCADKYSYAYGALQSSLQEMDTMSFDYAAMQLTAAKDYPNSCHNAYRRFPGLAYPVELARREDGLERICDVAMAIINLLDW